MTETFLSLPEHFQELLDGIPADVRAFYESCRHVRSETAYRNRHFFVYRMSGREPEVIDKIIVNDFECNDHDGASCEVTSQSLQLTKTISYTPEKLFSYPVMVWLPLHTKLRWSAAAGQHSKGSMGFPLTVRTASRFHLRERDVTYMETGAAFFEEFGTLAMD